ncbi:MAG: hypothetical protein J0H67_05015 [Rhodospirillales bacterium]|nr:hypothetical protein [Rhodospirillales bacterium]
MADARSIPAEINLRLTPLERQTIARVAEGFGTPGEPLSPEVALQLALVVLDQVHARRLLTRFGLGGMA